MGVSRKMLKNAQWKKITVNYEALKTAALNNNIEIFNLPAAHKVRDWILDPTIVFSGTTSLTISLGIEGDLDKFITAHDSMQLTEKNNETSHLDWTGNTSIKLEAISTVENLDQLTAGEVDIFILIDKIT